MHIVHVTHRAWPVIGGSERCVQEIARRQVLDGHVVTVVATDAAELRTLWDRRGATLDPLTASEHQGVHIRRLPVSHLPLGPLSFPALRRAAWLLSRLSPRLALPFSRFSPWIPALDRTLTEEQANLYIAWNITLEGLAATVARVARRRRVPWAAVPLLHLGRPRFHTMHHQLDILRGAGIVLAQTSSEQRFLLQCGLDAGRVHVISPGIDASEGSGADGARFRQTHHIDGPLVLTLGTLCRDKGTLHLIAAVQRLWREGRQPALALLGPQQREVQQALARLPEPHRSLCHVPGEVSEAEKWDALDAADVVALPSRIESFGLVYLEAWSRGKPVIGARAGAVVDVIEDGKDGLLAEYGNVGTLTQALRTLLDDPSRAAQMGRRGQVKVRGRYMWEHQYVRLRAAMDQIEAEQQR